MRSDEMPGQQPEQPRGFEAHEPTSNVTMTRKMAAPLGITFFRLVSEHGSDVASLHARDGQCVFVAPSIHRALGWSSEEVQGRSLFDFVAPEDWIRVEEALAVEGEATGRVTYRFRTPTGEYRWVETLTQATGSSRDRLVVCMTRDVSTHKRATTSLEEGVLALAMRQPDGVLVVQQGRVLHANPAALTQLAWSAEGALRGRRMMDLVHPEDAEAEVSSLERVAAKGDVSPLHDVRFARGDGAVLHAQAYALGVSFGGADAALVVLREKPRPDTQAILADRLRSIGTVAAGLAHDLADPVALLLASLDVLGGDEVDDVASRSRTEALSEARRSADRILEAMRTLRSFSRGDEDLRRAVDVREVVDAALHVAYGRVAPTTRVVRDFCDEPVFVNADQARISQALHNLISNAVDAANQRDVGEVRIIVRAGTKGGALIEVSDNGAGIDGNVLERVFEPFFTTKPIATACGLGLPIANAILRSLGGKLELESAPGAGTIALIQLPPCPVHRADVALRGSIAPRATIRVAPAPAPMSTRLMRAVAMPRATPVAERAKLLVVDDEVALGTSLRRILRHEYDIDLETSAEGALRRIVAGERYDLVLCDLNLPGKSGIELYGELQHAAPELVPRVIFITGGMNTPGTQAFLESLPNLWIDKPFLPDDLRTRLRELLSA